MQLPQNLQHFPHTTLIVISDHISGRFFLIGGENLEELDGEAMPRERKQDKQGRVVANGGHVTAVNSEPNDAPRLKSFVKKLAEHTGAYARGHEITHVQIAMPNDVLPIYENALDSEVKEKITRRLPLDLIQEHPLEIVRRLLMP